MSVELTPDGRAMKQVVMQMNALVEKLHRKMAHVHAQSSHEKRMDNVEIIVERILYMKDKEKNGIMKG